MRSPLAPHQLSNVVMTQRWRSLTFLHWPYRPEAIARLLPPALEVDTFDGVAWVGLVPFVLSDLSWFSTPVVPWISHFPETNVRTYVKDRQGRPGVWFFTLEADRLLAVMGARTLYHLPYRWARMSVKRERGLVHYQSRRLPPFGSAFTNIAVQPGSTRELTDFDHYLTARFRLYTARGRRIASADIEHDPWPLVDAQIAHLKSNLIEQCGLPRESGRPVVHYSEDLTVRVDRLRWLKSGSV